MNDPLNPTGRGALLKARKILLIRAQNGWLVKDEEVQTGILTSPQPIFCFESTASLAQHLIPMLGETKWTVCEQPRDEKGKFQPKSEESKS